MSPLDVAPFGTDPWWLVLIKVVVLFVILLAWTIFNVWFERRVLGKMQNRIGPVMNSAWAGGVFQAVGDGLKLVFKEMITPKGADKFVFNLAPVIAGIACFSSWAVIPLGGRVSMFGHQTNLQVTDVPVAVLFIIAISSIGVYGIVLAGWSSAGSYSLLGALRSSASMISYEVAMGLSLVAVFMFSGTMSTSGIVTAQARPIMLGSFSTGIPGHYWLLLAPSFVIYVITMLGESNRTPFDMPECESELVSGFSTEYSGFPYGMYYLAEYINMATLSAVCVTLFLGGYRAPWPFNHLAFIDQGWWGLLWFFIKAQLVIFFFVWVRGALPRFRYDHYMQMGWKALIPISLVWVLLVALMRTAGDQGWFGSPIFVVILGVVVLALLAYLFLGGKEKPEPVATEAPFDAFAGGYPVPPLPGQSLSGTRVLSGTTEEPTPTTGATMRGEN
ncbi:NADH-quinone oxidoreductase subunit NuoH [Acidipropionibacterium timonense]|uniref:NADH-quinone oxidoreductase subunit NuoH n=1 Tax=Acidipropionibacterium timonense TaxID=2161818 RepID=UPI0010314DCF|nr:NADH-quinone oxidoreductase subunit NuoH [Acidipropionibacterium timonense]